MIMKNEIKKRLDGNYLKYNLKTNWLYVLSSIALIAVFTPWYAHIVVMGIGMFLFQFVFTVLFQVAVFSQISFITDNVKKTGRSIKTVSAVSTFGICCFQMADRISAVVRYRDKIQSFASRFMSSFAWDVCMLFNIAIVALSLLAGIIVYALTVMLLHTVAEQLREPFDSFSKTEKWVYAVITAVIIGFVCVSFFIGGAFWGKEDRLDVLFTSDTSILVQENAYMTLMHSENDLRQPLFAVFAAPFVGFGYAVSVPFSFLSPVVTPLMMNIVQVLMLMAGHLMLADMLSSDPRKRICVMLVTSATYTTTLFSLMMEQYIVCYFWLMFAVYSAVKKHKSSGLSICACGGTLLTGMSLLPLVHDYSDKKRSALRYTAVEAGKCLSLFVVLLLSFGRIDVILSMFVQTKSLSRFAGGNGFWVRIRQYLSFISSCFAAPETKLVNDNSLQLSENNYLNISLLGVIILILCLAGILLNKRDKLTVISGLWICFSFLILAVIGWGSVENGEILYSLYFSWAFVVLIFRLVEWVSDKLGSVWFTVIFSGLLTAALCAWNNNGIKDLWDFASVCYPV